MTGVSDINSSPSDHPLPVLSRKPGPECVHVHGSGLGQPHGHHGGHEVLSRPGLSCEQLTREELVRGNRHQLLEKGYDCWLQAQAWPDSNIIREEVSDILEKWVPGTVSSCITTYKKTPPPVPPRTTTKPFISITAQSSTESAQDAYMDGHGQRGDIISQSGLSNSTESLDSMKALTAAIEAANAQIHGPASQHMGSNTATVTTTTTVATVTADERKRDYFKKNRCLSIGIQVDGGEESSSSSETRATSKFQSIGVQVEEEKWSAAHAILILLERFTRSNSVTTAVQADMDFHENFEMSMDPQEDHSYPSQMLRQYSRDASTSTVSIQGSGNHYHACAVDDDFDTDFDPSILPPPDPWIDSITEDPIEAVQRSVCQRDGHWFLKLLQAERERMEGWCQQMEREEQENHLPEERLENPNPSDGQVL
ncbi:Disks large-associated protein 1 [Varanus komodoensis]|nr:Disks large-associated protein 1 [Varanus komodoensis]